MKKFLTIGCALLLALVMCGSALAVEDGLVRFEGGAEKFVFLPGSASSETDLFGESFKGVLPGDQLTHTVTVKNASGDKVRIFMRAEPVSAEDKDFLDQMTLTVTSGDETIFEGTAGEQDGLAEFKLLGTFKKKGSTDLHVTLNVPITMGSEYMGRIGFVPWTFMVEEVVEEETPETGDWFDLPVWIAAAMLIAAALVVVFLRSRRKSA